jgi:hypothetical protein
LRGRTQPNKGFSRSLSEASGGRCGTRE